MLCSYDHSRRVLGAISLNIHARSRPDAHVRSRSDPCVHVGTLDAHLKRTDKGLKRTQAMKCFFAGLVAESLGGITYWQSAGLKEGVMRTVMSSATERPEITADEARATNNTFRASTTKSRGSIRLPRPRGLRLQPLLCHLAIGSIGQKKLPRARRQRRSYASILRG